VYCYWTRNWLPLILCSSLCVNVDWSQCTQICCQWLYTHSTLTSEPNVLYASPNIIPALKSRCMRWAGHVLHTRERRVTYRVWWRDLKRQFGKLWRNEWKTLECILQKPVERRGLDWSGSEKWQVASPFEQGNEPSGSIKRENFLTGWGTISFPRTPLHRFG